MRFSFLKPVLLLTLVLAAIMAYPWMVWLAGARAELATAAGIALGNTLIGFMLIEYAFDKPDAIFMSVFLGGIGVRIMLILIVFAALIMEGFNPAVLTFSLMGFYFAYLILEIVYATRELSRRSREKRARSRATA